MSPAPAPAPHPSILSLWPAEKILGEPEGDQLTIDEHASWPVPVHNSAVAPQIFVGFDDENYGATIRRLRSPAD